MEYKKIVYFNENENLKENDIVLGTVKGIQPYGVFIQIDGGIVGLLYIEDISISRLKTPEEMFKIGQKIEVKVKSIDKDSNRVYFTHKELLGTWEDNIINFKEGTKVNGIAKQVDKNKSGIFIQLKPNLVGLAEYKDDIEYGENVEVYIKKIIPEKKKIKLVIL